MSDQTPNPPQKTSRGRSILLAGSLGLNVLIIGLVLGWVLSPGGPRGGERAVSASRSYAGEPFVRALEPNDRRALYQDLKRRGDALRENRSALQRRFEKLLAAIVADPFDPTVVQTLLNEQRGAAVVRQQIGEDLLLERLQNMTPEARAAFAGRLKENLRRRPPPPKK